MPRAYGSCRYSNPVGMAHIVATDFNPLKIVAMDFNPLEIVATDFNPLEISF